MVPAGAVALGATLPLGAGVTVSPDHSVGEGETDGEPAPWADGLGLTDPLQADSVWRQLDNVTVTPHLAGQSTMMRRLSTELVADAVRDLVADGSTRNTVNAADLQTIGT